MIIFLSFKKVVFPLHFSVSLDTVLCINSLYHSLEPATAMNLVALLPEWSCY